MSLAALVLNVPPDELLAHHLYKDLRQAADDASMEEQLDDCFEEWCIALGKAGNLKRARLTRSIITLTLALLLSVICLVESVGGPWLPQSTQTATAAYGNGASPPPAGVSTARGGTGAT